MNNNIEVGDTVRLVKGNNLFSDPELQEDFVVQVITEGWIDHKGTLIPIDWFEIMKGKDDPELKEAMDEKERFDILKEHLYDVANQYCSGESFGDYALAKIRSLMTDHHLSS